MKWWVIIFFLYSCTSVKEARKTTTTILLDSSDSYIIGGDGKGYFTMWNWEQIAGERIVIDSPNAPITKAYITSGSCKVKMTITDNLGQQKSDTISYKVGKN